jgi:hypothetical protein
MSICNAEKTADSFIISAKTMLRITNAYIHDCRIANSAGRDLPVTNHITARPAEFAIRQW